MTTEKLSSSLTPFDIEEPNQGPVFYSIRLNPGISVMNFVCSQIHYMIMIFAFGITDTLQPLILLDKSYYNADKDTAGTLIAFVLFIQLFIKISVSVFYGHLSDKIGRKPVLYLGAVSLLIGLLLAPLFTNVFPGFIIAKILVCNGCSALIILPFNADYVADESKGRAAGVTITLNAVGALGSNLFLKYLLYNNHTLGYCYWLSAFLIFPAFIANTFGLKGGSYYLLRTNQNQESLNGQKKEDKPMMENFREVVKIFKENGWLGIALVLQILGNADFYLAFTILALYVKSLFPAGTADMVSNIAVNNVQSFLFIPTLVNNVIYGYYIDKTNKVMNVIVLSLAGGTVGFVMTYFVDTPYDTILYLAAFIIGATMTGVYVASNYLCFTHYPKDKRGIMLGFTMLVGYVGYVLIATIGGYLFDHWRKNAPFMMYAALSIIALAWSLKIYKTKLAH